MAYKQTSFSAVLGIVLKQMREERSIDQGELSNRMGLSQASYSRLEGGKSVFTFDQAFEAAKALGVHGEDVFFKVTNMVQHLERNGVTVTPMARKNSGRAQTEENGSKNVGVFIAGAALGGLLGGILASTTGGNGGKR